MQKIPYAAIGTVSAILIAFAGALYVGTSGKTPSPTALNGAPMITSGYSSSQSSGQSLQQTIQQAVRGDTCTFQVAGGILARNGELAILNSHHYRDQANLTIAAPASLLPANTSVDMLKGKVVEAKGTLSKYRDKTGTERPQFLASTLTVK